MSWIIHRRKKDDKYRLWTTISDGWLTSWLTRDQMIQAIAEDYKREYKEKVDKLKKTFPNGWNEPSDKFYKVIEDKRYMSEYEWLQQNLKDLSKRYELLSQTKQ